MRKRDVLVAADLVRSIALFALPVAWLLGVLTMPLLLVVATVIGVATVAMTGVGVVVYNVAQVSFRQRLCPRPALGVVLARCRPQPVRILSPLR